MPKSRLECVNLGRIAAFPGTLMTPMYREAFLGEMSSVMSSKGDPLTLSRSKRSLVSSSDVDEPPSNTFTGSLVMTPGEPRKSEKFPWINSTAAKIQKCSIRRGNGLRGFANCKSKENVFDKWYVAFAFQACKKECEIAYYTKLESSI